MLFHHITRWWRHRAIYAYVAAFFRGRTYVRDELTADAYALDRLLAEHDEDPTHPFNRGMWYALVRHVREKRP